MTFFTCTTSRRTNKMPTLAHDAMKHRLDVIRITEAGLKQQLPTGMTGYKAVAHARPESNRGSVIWVRECYLNQIIGVYDPEDKDIGNEVIHLLMDTLPHNNIIGVYQETGKGKYEIENTHRILRNRVKKM